MTKQQIILAAILAYLGSSLSYAIAEQAAVPPADTGPWRGSIKFGYNEATGDGASTNGILNLAARYKVNQWNNNLSASGLISSSNGVRTASRYTLNGEANFFFRPSTFLFARTANTYDAFASYDITLSNAGGFGQRIFNQDGVSVELQAGPGDLRQRENENNQFNDELALFTKESVTWNISKTANLTHYISVEYGHPNTHMEGNIALNTHIVGHWGMSLSYTAIYDTFIPYTSVNSHKLDTLTQATVSYYF